MFWITNNDKDPLVETICFLEEKKGKYPHVIINNDSNNIKYKNNSGIILKKERKIVWEDASVWILAPKNIELVEGTFKNLQSLINVEVNVPIQLYMKKNNTFNKYVKGMICGIGNNKYKFAIQIGEWYYSDIEPGVLIIKLPKFHFKNYNL